MSIVRPARLEGLSRSFAISEKDGLKSGLDDQHLSFKNLHEGSHQFGISGRRLSLIIPAEKGKQKDKKESTEKHRIQPSPRIRIFY